MGTTADKLNKLIQTKAAIKQSISNKGVAISDDTIFAEYPALIDSIQAGGGDTYYEDLFNARTNKGTINEQYYQLFACSNATTLDVSNLDTSNVRDMSFAFGVCYYLTTLDLTSWDVSKVTKMESMFQGCASLTTLDVSNWDTSKVTDMGDMFQNCTSLESLDLSNFDTSNVKDMSYMFNKCSKLTTLDLSNFDTSNVTNMSNMFNGCSKLTTLNLSNWNMKIISSTYVSNMFSGCTALVNFQAPKSISSPLSFSSSYNLSHDSLMSIINNLVTTTTTRTLTLGSTNLAKLTDEEKAIATSKGWTVK